MSLAPAKMSTSMMSESLAFKRVDLHVYLHVVARLVHISKS